MKHKTLITIFLLFFFVLVPLNGQQICVRQSCPDQLQACDAKCTALMGECYFKCTLLSQGCMQNCIGKV